MNTALKRLEAENRAMRSDMKELKMLLRALITTDNEMREVRAWQLEKLKQRNRKSEERSRKKEAELVLKCENKESQCLTRKRHSGDSA